MKSISILFALFSVVIISGCGKEDTDKSNYPPFYTSEEVASFPGSQRENAVAFSSGDYGYVGLGNSVQGSTFKDFYRYDPKSDSWDRISDFPGGRTYGASAFVLNGYPYVGAGYDSSGFRRTEFWKYLPSSDNWQQVTDIPRGLGASCSFAVGNKGYVVYDYQEVYEYNPTADSWKRKSDFPGGQIKNRACFTLDRKAYLVGGYATYNNSHTNRMWEYDPSADKWTEKAALKEDGRSFAIAFTIGDYALAGTGNMHHGPSNDLNAYDQKNDKWYFGYMFPVAGPHRFNAFTIDDTAYFGGGYFASLYNSRYYKLHVKSEDNTDF